MIPLALMRPLTGVLAAIALLVGAFALGHHQGTAAEHERRVAQVATLLADASQRAAAAASAALFETDRRLKERDAIVVSAHADAARARADAVAAADARGRLQHRVAELLAAAAAPRAADPVAAAGSAPADTTADLLANVYRRLGEAEDGIAGFAEAAFGADAACVRQYTSLN